MNLRRDLYLTSTAIINPWLSYMCDIHSTGVHHLGPCGCTHEAGGGPVSEVHRLLCQNFQARGPSRTCIESTAVLRCCQHPAPRGRGARAAGPASRASLTTFLFSHSITHTLSRRRKTVSSSGPVHPLTLISVELMTNHHQITLFNTLDKSSPGSGDLQCKSRTLVGGSRLRVEG